MNSKEMKAKLQVALVPAILADLDTQRWSLLKVGARGGKNHMATKIAGRYRVITVFAQESSHAQVLVRQMQEQLPGKLLFAQHLPELSDVKILVILDEAMWFEDSYNLYASLLADERVHVLVISSRGPEYDNDLRWQLLPGRSFHSWDFNPSIPLADLIPEFLKVPELALRDYCAY